MNDVFKTRIKELRTKAGMTQKQFAEKAKITVTSYASYEQGDKFPSLDMAMKIAEAFNVSLDWLCGLKVCSTNEYPTNLGDLIKVIAGMTLSSLPIELGEEIVDHKPSDFNDNHFNAMDAVGNVHYAVFKCADKSLAKFFKDWGQLMSFTKENEAAKQMYSAWINEQIRKQSEIPIPYAENIDK